jgi:hypothetical protein
MIGRGQDLNQCAVQRSVLPSRRQRVGTGWQRRAGVETRATSLALGRSLAYHSWAQPIRPNGVSYTRAWENQRFFFEPVAPLSTRTWSRARRRGAGADTPSTTIEILPSPSGPRGPLTSEGRHAADHDRAYRSSVLPRVCRAFLPRDYAGTSSRYEWCRSSRRESRNRRTGCWARCWGLRRLPVSLS